MAHISLACSSESAGLALNPNSSAATCCRLWHLLTLLSPVRQGHRREDLLFRWSVHHTPEAATASAMDASWPGLSGEVLKSQSTSSFGSVCRAAVMGLVIPKHRFQAEVSWYLETNLCRAAPLPHQYLPVPFHLQGSLQYVLNTFSFYTLRLFAMLQEQWFL